MSKARKQIGDQLTKGAAIFRGCYAGIEYFFDPLLGEYGEFIPPPVE